MRRKTSPWRQGEDLRWAALADARSGSENALNTTCSSQRIAAGQLPRCTTPDGGVEHGVPSAKGRRHGTPSARETPAPEPSCVASRLEMLQVEVQRPREDARQLRKTGVYLLLRQVSGDAPNLSVLVRRLDSAEP